MVKLRIFANGSTDPGGAVLISVHKLFGVLHVHRMSQKLDENIARLSEKI